MATVPLTVILDKNVATSKVNSVPPIHSAID